MRNTKKNYMNFQINHKGKKNDIFYKWSKKYFVHEITSNYISYNDNTLKTSSKEVFVTNYDKQKI